MTDPKPATAAESPAGILKAIAVPFALLGVGGACSWQVLPPDAGFTIVVGALAWLASLAIGTGALGVIAVIVAPFLLWRWLRGKRDDAAAVRQRDRRFALAFPAIVAAWCGMVGMALGLVPGGWTALEAALLHAVAGGAVGWATRWTVVSRYGPELDAAAPPRRDTGGYR